MSKPIGAIRARFAKNKSWLLATILLICVVLLSALLGNANQAGYYVRDWARAAYVVAALFGLASVAGQLPGVRSRWATLAVAFFVGYAAWTCASLLWSPNQGDAWIGADQTLLYLLAFWLAAGLIASGASRHWVLLASVLGPAIVALLTLANLTSRMDHFFDDNRLVGTIQYFNGEAAFLLVPFWVAVYLAGSRSIHPVFRGLVLSGAVLCVTVAVLTQSRGAMVAMAVSLPVFFALSGQRLRGFLALVPIAATVFATFPGLNDVYLAFLEEGDPGAALESVIPMVWLCAVGTGLYGLLWGLIDRWWRPPVGVVHGAGGVVLAGCITALVFGAFAYTGRVGDPADWGQQKWEAFKANDRSGEEQSRYMSVGSGRYTMWKVAWEDFERHPILGVGTHNYEATYYQLREENVRFVRQPHSLPFEVLAERGVVGGALFFGFLATCLLAGLWARFGDPRSEDKGQIGALIAAVTYWFVHSSVDWFWQQPAVTLPAIVYLAVLVAPRTRAPSAESSPPRWPVRALGVAVAVAAIAAITPLYAANLYVQRAAVTWPERPRIALQDLERAQKINPVDYRSAVHEATMALWSGNWPRAKRAYHRAIWLNPEHYAPYYQLALVNEGRGGRKETLRLYRKASSLNPLDEGIERRLTKLEKEGAGDGSATTHDRNSDGF